MSRQFVARVLLCSVMLFVPRICADAIRETALYDAFTHYQEDTASFLQSVLPVVSLPELDIDECDANVSFYSHVYHKAHSFSTVTYGYRMVRMLNHQRAMLAEQTQQLLEHAGLTDINGYVEIGTPGTYIRSLQHKLPMHSPIYAVGDESDAFLSFSPNPIGKFQSYDHFVCLNNYQPITREHIPDNSVDVVTCYPGLHHIPADQLNDFVSNISRILRPGGVLIVREHDIVNDEITTMAHTAHELFNACVAQMSEDESNAEYRNFQPISYWKSILRRHGLQPHESLMLTQDGDPTANTLFACTKQPQTADESAQVMHTQYWQEPTQAIDTYLSTPEWFNVDVSQAYGDYINHTPFYEFPYWRSVMTYWDILYKSAATAYRRDGISAIMQSPYFAVGAFIGAFMTVEYGAKAVISWPLSRLYGVHMEPQPLYISLYGHIPSELQEQYGLEYVDRDDEHGVCVYKALSRYVDFVDTIKNLAHNWNGDIIRVNGHDTIQCKVKAPADLDVYHTDLGDAEVLYDWTLPTRELYRYYAIAVPTSQLLTFIRSTHERGLTIVYIHDF